MPEQERVPVPDLATEDIPDDILSSCSDLVEEVADPLLPADRTLVGLEEVTEGLLTAKRVVYYPNPDAEDDLSAVRLSPGQAARQVIESARRSPQPVLVTARCYGPDMELRTVEFMPRTRPRRR